MDSSGKTGSFVVHSAHQLLAGTALVDRRELLILKKRVSIEPGRFLIQAGEDPSGVYIHRSGIIETIPVQRTDDLREETDIECVYGLMETLAGADFDFSIKSVTQADFDMISRDDLLDFLRHRPKLVQRLNLALSTQYRIAVRRITEQ